jgi:tetratricopeptide (TPR) repeat protein
VSGPTRVDQPVDVNDVHRTAQNWRDMARHLQDDLKDPVGARQLLENAIEHREKHGLLSTLENAQAHIDLARSLGKTENFSDAESHLRTALQIYEQIEAAPDHIADLVHYIAVVTDRQRKRREAEMLYRKALDIYKVNNVSGSNVDIAVKNLDLNLRKQRVSSN